MIGFVPAAGRSRRAVVVLQSSLTDCGPAALKSVLDGFGLEHAYDFIRERCQTDVDGTSIDALAALGCELGLDSRQVLVPHDHFLLPEARCLPAIVVTRSPGGLLHFVVVWRKLGDWVEVMDPGSGRRWVRSQRLLAEMPVLPLPISERRFREWAGSAAARRPWRARARALGLSRHQARELIDAASRDTSWIGLACLDAALRMTAALVAGGAVAKGRQAARTLELLASSHNPIGIPDRYRWLRPASDAGLLTAHGSVIVHFMGRKAPAPSAARLAPAALARIAEASSSSGAGALAPAPHAALPARANEQLRARDLQPLRVAWQLLREGRTATLAALLGALVVSAALLPVETFVLRGLLDLHRHLALHYQQLGWLAAALLVTAGALGVDVWTGRVLGGLGRELEARVRAALLERLPRLPDEYLRSRSSADMASRGHSLHLLRSLPVLWAQQTRAALSFVALTATLLWLYPGAWQATLLLALAALVVPFCGRRALGELSLRLRTQSAALDRFYLDTLLGQAPVRVHGAEIAVRTEHEQLLTEWQTAARQLHRRQTALQGAQACAALGVALTLVLHYLSHTDETTRLLLLAYFALRLPASAAELTSTELALRNLRGVALRALAPLAAPSEADPEQASSAATRASAPRAPGVHVSLAGVTVLAGGHALLSAISLEIAAGEHVAVVGASGAGKSSLVALLLGFHRAARGAVSIDGEPLDAPRARRLRRETAWVDPAVQLWDRSLYENLTFGEDDADAAGDLGLAVSAADLLDVLERLPDGLQSGLGEGGVCVSGGQGQRVRLGRALLRRGARLVLLDEPFRGLERQRRRELLERTRRHFRQATLLFVSHDVEDTVELDRVLVIDAGRIAESGDPRALLRDPDSRYSRLHRSSRELRSELWSAPVWRRLEFHDGRVREGGPTLLDAAQTGGQRGETA